MAEQIGQPGEALSRALAARGARVGHEDAARVADLLLGLLERGVLVASDPERPGTVHGAVSVAEPSTVAPSHGPAGVVRETRVRGGGRVALDGAGAVVSGALQTPDACNTGVCNSIGAQG